MNNFIKITGIQELKDFSINRSGALRNDLSMKIFKPELSKKFNTWKYRIIVPINGTPVQITFNSAKLLLEDINYSIDLVKYLKENIKATNIKIV